MTVGQHISSLLSIIITFFIHILECIVHIQTRSTFGRKKRKKEEKNGLWKKGHLIWILHLNYSDI